MTGWVSWFHCFFCLVIWGWGGNNRKCLAAVFSTHLSFSSFITNISVITGSPLSFKSVSIRSKSLIFKTIRDLSACLFLFFFSHSVCPSNKKFFNESKFNLKIYCFMLLIPSNLKTMKISLLLLVPEECHISNRTER